MDKYSSTNTSVGRPPYVHFWTRQTRYDPRPNDTANQISTQASTNITATFPRRTQLDQMEQVSGDYDTTTTSQL